MSADSFRHIYDRIIDAELGLIAINEILRAASPGDEAIRVDKRNGSLEWVAARVAEQLAEISDFAEEQERRAKGMRL